MSSHSAVLSEWETVSPGTTAARSGPASRSSPHSALQRASARWPLSASTHLYEAPGEALASCVPARRPSPWSESVSISRQRTVGVPSSDASTALTKRRTPDGWQ